MSPTSGPRRATASASTSRRNESQSPTGPSSMCTGIFVCLLSRRAFLSVRSRGALSRCPMSPTSSISPTTLTSGPADSDDSRGTTCCTSTCSISTHPFCTRHYCPPTASISTSSPSRTTYPSAYIPGTAGSTTSLSDPCTAASRRTRVT